MTTTEPATREEEDARKRALAQETLRKTFLAMGEDIRVVLIKLADRLHNMRTLGYMPRASASALPRKRWIFLPPWPTAWGSGRSSGSWKTWRFRYVNPEKYKEIAELLAKRRTDRESQVRDIIKRLKKCAGTGRRGGRNYRPAQTHLFHLQKDGGKRQSL